MRFLRDDDRAKWLGEEPATDEQLKAMLRPFSPERMAAWEVSKDVGKVGNQGAELVELVKNSP